MSDETSGREERPSVAVIGGGNFGTALANLLAFNGHEVALWVYEPDLALEMASVRENRRYVPGFRLEDRVRPTSDLRGVVTGRKLVVSVNPSHVTRAVMNQVATYLHPEAVVVCATKGIEVESQRLMSEVMEDVLPAANRSKTAYLSGPSFARELMKREPTVVAIASSHADIAAFAQKEFTADYFRVYTSDDVVGIEVAGAVKNVMAIAAGISDGLGFGHNTRAAIVTRGLAEITRLGVRMGAQPLTFMGLAGVGDLVLTCTGDLSRNRTVGLRLGKGDSLELIVNQLGQVAEGVNTTRAVFALSRRLQVEMPIVEAVYAILHQGKSPRAAVEELMRRPLKREGA